MAKSSEFEVPEQIDEERWRYSNGDVLTYSRETDRLMFTERGNKTSGAGAEQTTNSEAVNKVQLPSMSYKTCMDYVLHAENYTLTFDEGLEIWYRPKFKTYRNPGDCDCRTSYRRHIGPEKRNFINSLPDAEIFSDFLESVASSAPMKVTLNDALTVSELAEAIEKTLHQGWSLQ